MSNATDLSPSHPQSKGGWRGLSFRLVVAIVPAMVVTAIYEWHLGHRHDYTGHYAAGYGGTLGAIVFGLRLLAPARFTPLSVASLVPACLVCILLGIYTEATIFRLAKFDELDFCNQSLGAVLAAVVGLAYAGSNKPPDHDFDQGMIVAVAFLLVGSIFAVA